VVQQEQVTMSRSLPSCHQLLSANLYSEPSQVVLQCGEIIRVLANVIQHCPIQDPSSVSCITELLPYLLFMGIVEGGGLIIICETWHSATAAVLRDIRDQEGFVLLFLYTLPSSGLSVSIFFFIFPM
jgi:hypothetical protein